METGKPYDNAAIPKPARTRQHRALKYIQRHFFLLLMLAPGTIVILVFYYLPIYGIAMAFENFSIGKGVFGSPFVGLANFFDFFSSAYFVRTLSNTFILGVLTLVFSFPAPILFALMLNEVKNAANKRVIQTISYLPHFISTVILCGLVFTFLNPSNGIVTQLLKTITGRDVILLGSSRWFRTIYVTLGVYGSFGWNSIIYLAALSGIDPALYEAARIDGASRWRQMTSVTLPSLSPTIVIMLILGMGSLLNVGFETVYLLSSPAIYDVADVINTYTYRRGVLQMDFGYGSAVGFFNAVVNFAFVWVANVISRKFSDVSLW